MVINNLLEKIKKSKKYSSINDRIIIKEIENHLKSHQKQQSEKEIIKNIRAKLHKIYSSYQTKKKKKRENYLDELKRYLTEQNLIKIYEITNKLLSTTISTKERLSDYRFIYSRIFKITGKPEIIIDLGSGLNPCSYPYMNLSHLNYHSYDIDEEDVKFLNKYFNAIKKEGLDGRAEILDVRETENTEKIPNSDIVFMFKLIDSIDNKKTKPKISEELINCLIKKTKFIAVSFATKTLTRKKMNLPKRKGFELMLERVGLIFESFSTDNEVFYIIQKPRLIER